MNIQILSYLLGNFRFVKPGDLSSKSRRNLACDGSWNITENARGHSCGHWGREIALCALRLVDKRRSEKGGVKLANG